MILLFDQVWPLNMKAKSFPLWKICLGFRWSISGLIYIVPFGLGLHENMCPVQNVFQVQKLIFKYNEHFLWNARWFSLLHRFQFICHTIFCIRNLKCKSKWKIQLRTSHSKFKVSYFHSLELFRDALTILDKILETNSRN